MSYTIPDGVPYGKPVNVFGLIRQVMAGEIIAINAYNKQIRESNIKEVNEVLSEIRNDEEVHYNLLLGLLRKYDPEQREVSQEQSKNKEKQIAYESKKLPDEDVIANIRHDIKGELEAINLYEANLVGLKNKEMKNVFAKIINDEKEHLEELNALVNRLEKQKK